MSKNGLNFRQSGKVTRALHRDRLLWTLVVCVALALASVPLCMAALALLNVAYFGALGGARCCVVVVEWLDGAEGWR